MEIDLLENLDIVHITLLVVVTIWNLSQAEANLLFQVGFALSAVEHICHLTDSQGQIPALVSG